MSSLNLATIVLRLSQNKRGWRVDALCAELEIAPRTYRKYRKLLQDQFVPFFQDGASRVQEVVEPDGRYLRLVDPPSTAVLASPARIEPAAARDARQVVELLFANDRWLQRYLRERAWYPDQRFEEVTGGRLRMAFRVDALNGVREWIQQFGSDVEVLRPIGLRRQL